MEQEIKPEAKQTEVKQAEVMPVQAAQPPMKAVIAMGEDGVFVPATLDDEYRICKMIVASGMAPARFTTPEMVVVARQMARELRLPSLIALTKIAIVQGTPCIWGDLPLAIVQRDGNLEWMREFCIDEKGNRISWEDKNALAVAVAAICIAKRKGDKEPVERSFSLAEARAAGIDGGPTWKKYPKIMLKYRARSQVLKDKFADSLFGIPISEYDFHEIPDEDSPKIGDAASDLNKQFL